MKATAGRALLVLLTLSAVLFAPGQARAEQPDLALLIDEQLASLDLRQWEELRKELPEEIRSIWGEDGVKELLSGLTAGKAPSLQDAAEGILGALKQRIAPRLLLVSALLGMAALSGAAAQIRGSGSGSAAGLVCYGMTILIAVYAFAEGIGGSRQAVQSAQKLMELAFPVLMTLLASAGATASAGLFQPATALMTGTVTTLCEGVLLPLVLTMGVLAVVGNLSEQKPLSRMLGFVRTLVKWITGGMSTLYIGYLGVMGIAAKGADGLSLRAARFAVDKLVPYVGSMVSGSVETLAGCAVLIKNALGLCGVLLMVGILLSPLLDVLTLQLAFRLAAALMEPVADARLTRGVSDLADVLSCMISVLVVVGLMFALTVGMIAAAGNSLL